MRNEVCECVGVFVRLKLSVRSARTEKRAVECTMPSHGLLEFRFSIGHPSHTARFYNNNNDKNEFKL